MTAYLALLRGLNVGGHHRVPMAELRALCEGLGHERVGTYIQSGNVLFASEGAPEMVASGLEGALVERFGFDVPVVLRTRDELAAIAARHPFAERTEDETKLHAVFFPEAPPPARLAAFDPSRFGPEEVAFATREAYVYYPNGAGRSKLSFDALGVPGTARNWRTVRTLAGMLEELAAE